MAVAALGSSVLAVSLLGLPSQAAVQTARGAQATKPAIAGGESTVRTPGYVDARVLHGKALVKAQGAEVSDRSKAVSAYYKSLGAVSAVDIDPLTGTVRNLGRLDGYLTGPSSAPARSVALTYVRNHLAALGLTSADLSTLRLRSDYVDNVGMHHLSWSQEINGMTVFGNGLKVNVTRDGRVLSVQGSPVSGLAKLAASLPAVKLTATQARDTAARNVGGKLLGEARVTSSRAGSQAASVWANHDFAKRVLFLTPDGLRQGWSTYVQSSAGSYQHVVDATTGHVLFRRSTTDNAAGDAKVYDNYPGAARGGDPRVVNFYDKGWLAKTDKWLTGNSVYAWSDVNDDNATQDSEKTPVPGTKSSAQFKLHTFGTEASSLCSDHYQCTWDPNTGGSWKTNRKADVTQAFYLASHFHDYLRKSPIGFTKQAGNFSTKGGDPVLLNALDGAATAGDMPDGNHIDNANMSTPPDGTPPTMQMYLWHIPGATDDQDPWVATSSAFDASVEYHEYTHGLSNRLVVDADGNSTLNSIQAGSMGEAWSDYYAMDYLVHKGFVKDGKAPGDVLEGAYLTAGRFPFRTEAIDCGVKATTSNCTDIYGGQGGYTYGDFPTIGGSPEVHSSGEVWAQTLWDIRKRFGHKIADKVITRGMSLSANDPSMLDMRNAIIQADLVAYNAAHYRGLWQIFANRGMGYFAGATSGDDAYPAQSFKTPPAPNTPHDGMIAGFVTDPTTGDPVEGALVTVSGQGGQYQAYTDSDGIYYIFNLYVGTYKKVVATKGGYFGEAQPATAVRQGDFSGGDATNFSLTRDWAATGGGAEVTDFNGPDYSPQCGPEGALDTSLTTGWGSDSDTADNPGVFVPKHITVSLPRPVDISSFAVDPSATCGDGGSASTGDYKIEVSSDGTTWVTAAQGHFGKADRGQLNSVDPTVPASGISYVRFTIEGNQVHEASVDNGTPGTFEEICGDPSTAAGYSGCDFADLTEFAVLGSPTAP